MEASPGSASRDEGARLLKSGQFEEAIHVLEQVAKSDPDDPQVHTYLGAAYYQKGDRLHAIYEFEESLRLQETPKSYYNLGKVYEEVHRVDEAIRQYRMAVEMDASYAPAREALDRLHTQFEKEHPRPEAAQTAPCAAQPTMVGAPPPMVGQAPAQTFDPSTLPGQKHHGPPTAADYHAQQAQKQLEIEQQHKAMMKSGLIYGMICGAVFMVLIYFASQMFMFSVPLMFTKAGGMVLLVVVLLAIGALYGGLIGLWVGHRCGGDSAGMQAGAAMGAVLGVLLGLLARSGVAAVLVLLVVGVLAGGVMGMIIGRLVEMSIGWD